MRRFYGDVLFFCPFSTTVIVASVAHDESSKHEVEESPQPLLKKQLLAKAQSSLSADLAVSMDGSLPEMGSDHSSMVTSDVFRPCLPRSGIRPLNFLAWLQERPEPGKASSTTGLATHDSWGINTFATSTPERDTDPGRRTLFFSMALEHFILKLLVVKNVEVRVSAGHHPELVELGGTVLTSLDLEVPSPSMEKLSCCWWASSYVFVSNERREW